MLLKLVVLIHASSLDINMGFYHTKLSPGAKQLCDIILPWGEYEYKKLPMSVCNSPDIFQEKISELFKGFDTVRAYINNVLVITKKYFTVRKGLTETRGSRIKSKRVEITLQVNRNLVSWFLGRESRCETSFVKV